MAYYAITRQSPRELQVAPNSDRSRSEKSISSGGTSDSEEQDEGLVNQDQKNLVSLPWRIVITLVIVSVVILSLGVVYRRRLLPRKNMYLDQLSGCPLRHGDVGGPTVLGPSVASGRAIYKLISVAPNWSALAPDPQGVCGNGTYENFDTKEGNAWFQKLDGGYDVFNMFPGPLDWVRSGFGAGIYV